MAKKIGRPSKLTIEIQAEILERLAGGETARSICREERMPDWTNLCRFRAKPENEMFRNHYADARKRGMEARLDEIWERVSDTSRDVIFDEITTYDEQGNVKSTKRTAKSDNTPINRDRLIADQLKWEAARIYKDIYGDKVTQEVTGADGGPIQYSSVVDKPPIETPEEWQQRVQAQLAERAKHVIQ